MQQQPTEFTKLIKCWQSLPKSEGNAPFKNAFSPIKIPSLVPSLFLLEREDSGFLDVRLVGSELEEKGFLSPRGSNVFETMMKASWEFYDRFMERCGSQVCAGHLSRRIIASDGLIHRIESLQLPLADADGAPRFVIGVMLVSASGNREGAPLTGQRYRRLGKPVEGSLTYEFIDLGHGIPSRDAADPALVPLIKSNADKDPHTISREYAQ